MSLGTGAVKGWCGPCANMRHSREVAMVTQCLGTSPASSHHFSGNTFLKQYLPRPDSQDVWEGQAVNLQVR